MTENANPHKHQIALFDFEADIRAALVFLTRLPVNGNDRPVRAFCWAFPIVGLVVGAASGLGLMLLSGFGLTSWFCALFALAIAAMITGALHEDGLSDMVDGLWGGYTKERRLEIMRDSRVGGFGALALVIITGMKAALLVEIMETQDAFAAFLALMAAHAMSRVGPVVYMYGLNTASSSGLAAASGRPGSKVTGIALLIGVGTLLFLIGFLPAIKSLFLLAAFAWILAQILKSKLGGYNGDCLGALQQISEITILACASLGGALAI